MMNKHTTIRGNEKKLPHIIPPGSVFRLARNDQKTVAWTTDVGRVFRVGYYSRQDGLDTIWLVNEDGKYEQTTDRKFLLKYFEPIQISDETDLYGTGKPTFKCLSKKNKLGR